MARLPRFEQMDLMYLGRELDSASGQTSDQPLLLRHKSLTTHAVILGMTGSGKTGLGIGLLEEAALDRVPAIIIDPKGDMANLLLSFPDLAPEDFAPWIDDHRADQQGMDRDGLARKTAETWRAGLARWGQDGERIRRMRQTTEFTVYTPGSEAGNPVSVLDSLRAPQPDMLADNELMAGLINPVVSSLLGLLDIDADPLKSREHILLSSILLHHWRAGQDLDLETIIGAVLQPPMDRIGVFPMESFYPRDQRMDLALRLNAIIASPAFSNWNRGAPLDIDAFLYTRQGKPRHAIFTIAHLNDRERMFFVTMLLNRLLGWMRRQQGSSTLRCILYMDEIFGYFPPTAQPPAKKTMMLLLKQARAFGLGIVLSTQNPVDLDYRGLSNIGTWFIGRLQTRQDQDRVLSGIESASDRFDPAQLRDMLAGMRGRTFLLSSVHREEPVLFETRWVLSYLKGPVSLRDIGRLVGSRDQGHPQDLSSDLPLPDRQAPLHHGSTTIPIVPARLTQGFLPAPVPMETITYRPWLAGSARVRLYSQKRGIDQEHKICLWLPAGPDTRAFDWSTAMPCPQPPEDADSSPAATARYLPVSNELTTSPAITAARKSFADFLYHEQKLPLYRVRSLKLESTPEESAQQFQHRVAQVLAGKKDREMEKLTKRYRKKQETLQARLEKSLVRLEKEKGDVMSRGVDTALSFGVAIFGALFGKGRSMAGIGRSARGVRSGTRLLKEKADVKRAEQDVARNREALLRLQEELEQKMAALHKRFSPSAYDIESFTLSPRRADITDVRLTLLWEPVLDPAPANP